MGEITVAQRCVAVIEGFFDRVEAVVWRPGALEFATVCLDGFIRAWKVMKVEGSGMVWVKMAWGSGCSGLVASSAALSDPGMFSTTNRKLSE